MLDDIIGLWWDNITGPLRLVERIVSLLNAGRSAVLLHTAGLPWLTEFRDSVNNVLNPDRFELLFPDGDCPRSRVVSFLLGRLSPAQLSRCPVDEKRQIEFLKREQVFAGSLIWLSGDSAEQMNPFVRFVSEYRGDNRTDHGAFVLEIPGAATFPQLSRSVEVISCTDFITPSDRRLFADILAGSIDRIPPLLKEYAARLCAEAAGPRVDLVLPLLNGIDFAAEEPAESALSALEYYDAEDVRSSIRSGSDLLVWRAQLHTAFAGIEAQRSAIVHILWDVLDEAISTEYYDLQKQRSGYVAQYGERPDSPDDLELGTIVYMMTLYRAGDRDRRLLVIPDEALRSRICFLSGCRNHLAHHQVIAPAEFYQLMELIGADDVTG